MNMREHSAKHVNGEPDQSRNYRPREQETYRAEDFRDHDELQKCDRIHRLREEVRHRSYGESFPDTGDTKCEGEQCKSRRHVTIFTTARARFEPQRRRRTLAWRAANRGF